jgi:hypothetical protein
MKKYIPFWVIVYIFSPIALFSQTMDPVIIHTGETFQTNQFQSYGWGNFSNLFHDSDGNLHGAYVDNYKLYYFYSEDNGITWNTQQIITGYEGKIKMTAIAVNSEGKIFIPFEIHPNYNYGLQPIGYPQFIYQVHVAVSDDGENWTYNLLLDHTTSNQGYFLKDILMGSDDKVHIITEKYGWYSYGGSLQETVYDPVEESWATTVIVTYSDVPVDNLSVYSKAAINADGDIAVIFWRSYLNKWYYVVKPYGEEWPVPQVFDENPAFRHFSLAAGPDGDFHIVWVKGTEDHTLNYKHGFNGAPEVIFTGEPDINIVPAIHVDQAGRITVEFYQTVPQPSHLLVKETVDGEWSEPQDFPCEIPISSLLPSKRTQGSFSHLQTLYFTYIRQAPYGPHGPDTLHFWQKYNYKQLILNAQPADGGSVYGEGDYIIDSLVQVEAEPEYGFHFMEWQDEDGNSVSTSQMHEFTMPYFDYSLTAIFELNSYTITATSGDNGTISNEGENTVSHGMDMLFEFFPDEGYVVSDVLINGESIGVHDNFEFTDIQENKSIHVEFELGTAVDNLWSNDISISVYPNPALSHVTIDFKNLNLVASDCSFSMYDFSGRFIFSRKLTDKSNTISLEGISPGLYVIKINSPEGIVKTMKFIKR